MGELCAFLGLPQLRACSIAWISMRHSPCAVHVSLHGEKTEDTEVHCFQPCLSFWSLSEIQQFGLDLLLLSNTNTIISAALLFIWAGASDWKLSPGAWALVWLVPCLSNSWTCPQVATGSSAATRVLLFCRAIPVEFTFPFPDINSCCCHTITTGAAGRALAGLPQPHALHLWMWSLVRKGEFVRLMKFSSSHELYM